MKKTKVVAPLALVYCPIYLRPFGVKIHGHFAVIVSEFVQFWHSLN